ncbi:hypothetical protein K6V78_02275 [Streptococcus gallolyticus]|nr:hypothetical protein [Streptococcus gallolyticus]MBY5040466.1 hypothetical protein [Streptococcus gallolyticus]
MPPEVWINLIGTCVGTFGGIYASSKLTAYRIEQLEKRVDKHNNVIERTFKLEEHTKYLDDRIERIEKGE